MDDVTTLYRPVGLKELELIRSSGMREFPPRLSWQPIFYPVLNEQYAVEIARDWNTKDAASGHAGFVTRFAVRSEFLALSGADGRRHAPPGVLDPGGAPGRTESEHRRGHRGRGGVPGRAAVHRAAPKSA